jgi:hypothetical protein
MRIGPAGQAGSMAREMPPERGNERAGLVPIRACR